MLVLQNIEFSYNNKKILCDINLEINKGECVFLKGASGVGKTTLAHIICGYIKPDMGAVFLDGKEITGLPNKKVLITSQNNTLYPYLNVYKQLSFIGGNNRKKILNLLKDVGLENDLKKYPFELSGGMKKRLLLARALYLDPEVIILDEIFSALDNSSKENMFEVIKKVNQEKKISFVIISHVNVDEELITNSYKLYNKQLIKEC